MDAMLNEHDLIDFGIMKDYETPYDALFNMKQEREKESDPNGKSAKEPGSKLDAGKSPVYQGLLDYFPRACLAVADVSAAGAKKYSWKGWETVADGYSRYSDALVRHIVNKSIEGSFDPDGFLHDAQIAWNAMAALELKLKETK